MAPKRKAGASKATEKPSSAKKTKSAPAPTALETVQNALSGVAETISKAVEVAGDLTLDEPAKTPVGLEEAANEAVDVPALKKKGKKAVETAKSKASKAAADAEAAAEKVVEEKTGVDVKAVKGKATKAAKVTKGKVEEAVEVVQPEIEKAAKPLKGKAAKAAQQAADAAEQVKEAANDPKNRKKAEDYLHAAEEGVMAAVSKVGEVVSGVVSQFGQASGLTADVDAAVQKGKKGKKVVEDKAAEVAEPVKKKGKEVADKASKVVEEGTKAGKKAKKAVEETADEVVVKGKKGKKAVEETVETAKVNGAKGKKAVEETAESAKSTAKKGKKAAEEIVETAKTKGAKGKKAAEETVETTKAKATKGKKAADETANAASEAVTTGKRKAAAAAETAEPVVKKAKAAAAETVEKGKKAGKAAAKAVAETVEEAESETEEFIHGFSSSDGEGADSSDDESDDDEDAAVAEAGRKIDMSKMPMIAKDDKSVQARLRKAQKKKDTEKGTLYLGRIPHGFYEEEMKEYFSQFGDVTQIRLARNRKTGASKHYAYLEMSSQSVAQIVSETMNNYLLMGHLLKCQIIPQDQVHPKLWEGANKKFRQLPRARLEKERQEKPRTEEQKATSNKRVKANEDKRRQKIKEAGIDYEFEGHE